MPYQHVTCPETAHLELIEYERDTLGLLIVACSRFLPQWRLRCGRTCAARMDRRDRTAEDVDLACGDQTWVGVAVIPLRRASR